MKGKPKFLNTKQDYLNFLAMGAAENVTDADKKQALEDLLVGTEEWFAVGNIDKDAGITDATHKVVVNEDTTSGTVTYTQYEFKKNEGARIFQLGFTIAEVQSLLAKYQ